MFKQHFFTKIFQAHLTQAYLKSQHNQRMFIDIVSYFTLGYILKLL
jgi:hypothetical protein